MRHLILGILILLAQPMFSQVFTFEQKDFCIETFKKYLNVKEELIEERLVTLELVQREQEDISEWYRNNIVRIDSVMNASIELVKQDESMKLADLLEKERYNIYAHPHNDTYLPCVSSLPRIYLLNCYFPYFRGFLCNAFIASEKCTIIPISVDYSSVFY